MDKQEVEQLETRVNDLECQIAFQEHTIEELNEALSKQQQCITEMQYQMKHIISKVKTINESSLATEEKEAPPPHY